MVNIELYSISAKGETLAEASRNYLKKVAESGTNSVVSSDEAYGYTAKGKVSRISSVVQDGSTYYYLTIDGSEIPKDTIFIGNYSISDELPITREGDHVIVKYIDDKNGTVDMIEFDNTVYGNIPISDDQKKRDKLDDEATSALDSQYNTLIDVEAELNEEIWNKMTADEKAKLIKNYQSEETEK